MANADKLEKCRLVAMSLRAELNAEKAAHQALRMRIFEQARDFEGLAKISREYAHLNEAAVLARCAVKLRALLEPAEGNGNG